MVVWIFPLLSENLKGVSFYTLPGVMLVAIVLQTTCHNKNIILEEGWIKSTYDIVPRCSRVPELDSDSQERDTKSGHLNRTTSNVARQSSEWL